MKKIALSGKNGSGKFALIDDEDCAMISRSQNIVNSSPAKKTIRLDIRV